MPANQPYPGESQEQFIARMQNPQNQVLANPAAGIIGNNARDVMNPQTIAEMVAALKAGEKEEAKAPLQQPAPVNILPENPNMQQLSQFAPRIGQRVPAIRGPGMMVIGSRNAQIKYAQAMYQRQRQMQIQQEQQRKAQAEMQRMRMQQQGRQKQGPNPAWQGMQNDPRMQNWDPNQRLA